MAKVEVRMSAGAQIDDSIYLSAIGMNGLFEYMVSKNELHYLMPFSSEDAAYSLHSCAVAYGYDVWFIPQHGRKVAVYNVRNKNLRYIILKYREVFESPFDQLPTISYKSVVEGEYLYILPAAIDSLNVVNMSTGEVTAFYNMIKKGESIVYGAYHEGKIQAFTSDGNWRIEVDVLSGIISRYEWNYGPIADIVWNDSVNGFVVGKAGEAKIYIFNDDFSNAEQKTFSDGECFNGYMKQLGDKIWLYPWESKKIIKLDINTWKREITDLTPMEDVFLRMRVIYSDSKVAGMATTEGLLFYLDDKSSKWEKIFSYYDTKEMLKKLNEYSFDLRTVFWKKTENLLNEKDYGLDAFIEYIK